MENTSSKFRFLVLDDHKIVLRGVHHLLKEHFQGSVIDLVAEEHHFLSMVNKYDYSVVIMDLNLPNFDPIALLPNLLKKKPNLKVLVYSMHLEHIFAKRMLALGAKGYIQKEADATELINAINTIIKGGVFLSPQMSSSLFSQAAKNQPMTQLEQLSDREFEVLNLLIRGYSATKIVSMLNVHASTISTYKNRIFKKLGVENMVELVQVSREYGMM